MRVATIALGLLLTALSGTSRASDGAASELQAQQTKLSDSQIKKLLIAASIAAYSGNCPCPYSTMRNGRRCGRRSAYDREGGEAPLCYEKDVTAEMVQAYRQAHSD